MLRFFAQSLIWSAVLGLSFQAPQSACAQPAGTQPAGITTEQCSSLSDNEVHDKIRALASAGLKTELEAINYVELVNIYWSKTNAASRIDSAVDAAIATVRSDTSWFDRAYSKYSPNSAERYAKAVADKAYNSEAFKAAVESLAAAVATDAGARIEQATKKLSNPVLECVQAALHSRYGGAVAQAFAMDALQKIETTNAPGVSIGTAEFVMQHPDAISGVLVIVTREVIAKIAQSIGSRIAGVVASRLVGLIAGGIGVILIAKDVYEAGDGIFPVIAEQMKSDKTKTLIKDEIGKSLQTDITAQAGAIAEQAADRIYSLWADFKQKYYRLFALGAKDAGFLDYLKSFSSFEKVGKLAQLVDIIYASEGEPRVFARVADGSLNKALLGLDDNGLKIAAEQKSLEKALQWTALAGDALPQAVESGIYRWLSPGEVTPEKLRKILSLSDKNAIARLANLEPGARDAILNLPADLTQRFALRLNARELTAFADYERNLEPAAAKRLLGLAVEDPSIMQGLSGEGLRQAVMGSRDQLAALNMLIHENANLLSYGRIAKDAGLVRDGAVSYRVFWERYWLSIIVAGFVLLVFLSWIRRLLFGRPQIIVRDSKR
jgi:hypothetical protein